MPITLIDKIKQKSGDFKLLDAVDIDWTGFKIPATNITLPDNVATDAEVDSKLQNRPTTDQMNSAIQQAIGKVDHLRRVVLDKYNTDEYKKVVLVYTKYVNQIATKVEELTLLPLQYKPNRSRQIKGPDIEGDSANLLDKLTKKYLMNTIFIKLTECVLSEQSCRRNAMDNADKNAEEIVDKLKIEYNKARQAAITQEITEVVSGSANK